MNSAKQNLVIVIMSSTSMCKLFVASTARGIAKYSPMLIVRSTGRKIM